MEDDPATRVALRELLDDAGYAPTEAADGETALEALSAGAYDLLLLDLGLPGISGGAVREIVRRDPRTRFLPIVLLSARAELEAKVAELRAGADDYITKPYDADELLARLGAAVRRTNGLRSLSPLSGLPGNTTITEEIEARLARGDAFALLYVDIDHFKEFNDRYSYNDGDRVIYILSRILHDVVKGLLAGRGFVGHIGGDDFIFIIPFDDIPEVCGEVLEVFDTLIPYQYNEQDRRAGYYFGKDRRGQLHRVPLMTLSIGIVTNQHRRFAHPAQVSELATEMKSYAKTQPGSVFVVDRRHDPELDETEGRAR